MLLVYPIAGGDVNTISYRENAIAAPLSKGGMLWCIKMTSDLARLHTEGADESTAAACSPAWRTR